MSLRHGLQHPRKRGVGGSTVPTKVGRGIAGDLNGNVWAAVGGDGQSYLAKWSGGRCSPNGLID